MKSTKISKTKEPWGKGRLAVYLVMSKIGLRSGCLGNQSLSQALELQKRKTNYQGLHYINYEQHDIDKDFTEKKRWD